MKVLLAPHGTLGDVQPTLALGLALRKRGHEVEVAAPHDFTPWIESLGFTSYGVAASMARTLRDSGDDSQKLIWQLRHLIEDMIPAQFESLPGVCPDADIIVGAGLQLAGASVAESRGVPYLAVAYCPVAIPTRHLPPPPIPWQRLPPLINRLSWWLGGRAADILLQGPINRGRLSLGLRPIRSPIQHMLSRAGVILAADSQFAPVPPDVSNVVTTEAWIFEQAGSLSEDLEGFLSEGAGPVYVGFGSMVTRDPGRVTRQVIEAGEMAGCRMLLGSGWTGLGLHEAKLPASCKVIDSTPHHILFPRVAAVVHHGGAGTTTSAARAGVPQIVVPHLLDQFYWAHRVEALGLGPKPLPVRRLNARRLAARLAAVLRDSKYRERARSLGGKIQTKNGTEAGARIVEDVFSRFHLGT